MLTTLLLGAGLLAASPDTSPSPTFPDQEAYRAAKAQAGRGSEAQVQLALWCEAHGMAAERVRHLAMAVLSDPKNATARGLMGLVDFRGRWERPESVSEKVRADEALTARLAEYNGRRERLPETADAHWKLALWCEENGLKPEARAHLASVIRIEPNHESARKRLGFRKLGHRWATDAQLAEEKAELEAQRQADQRWRPLLLKWRAWLNEKGKRAEAEELLASVRDPRAVPSVWSVFASGDKAHQVEAVVVLGAIDAPSASKALAMMAVYSGSAEVRRAATETLRRRDTRDFVDMLVAQVRDPLRYEVRPVGGVDMPGELFVEGESYNVRRLYGVANQSRALAPIPPRIFGDGVAFDPFGGQNQVLAMGPMALTLPGAAGAGVIPGPGQVAREVVAPNVGAMAARRDFQIAQTINRNQQVLVASQQQLENDVAAVEATNAGIRDLNERTLPVLRTVTGQDLGADAKGWRAWWTDQKGYAYKSSEPTFKPTLTTLVQNPYDVVSHHSCFGAGTLVRTLDGRKAIETLRVGDQVLGQDSRTGKLGYTPIVAVFHNPPAATLKVTMGDEAVVATGIHRFWKAGQGWTMARDLKPGDVVRTLGGTTKVDAVEIDSVRPVYNLEVADGHDFFVGSAGTLVHDNSLVLPEARPFDVARVSTTSKAE